MGKRVKERMKVLIVAPYYAPSSEVPSVRMVSLSNYLVENGHSVSVVCWSREKLLTLYKENELSSSVPKGVEVIEFNSEKKGLPFLDDLRWGKEFESLLPKIVDLKKYDVIFVTCGPYFTLKAMPSIKRRYRVPYVLDFRDLGALNYRPKLGSESEKNKTSWWKQIAKSWYTGQVKRREYNAVKDADYIICVSPIDKAKMQEAYNIDETRICIATNGYDEKKLAGIVPEYHDEKVFVGAVFGKFMYYSKKKAEAILKGINTLKVSGISIKLIHIGRMYDYINDAIKENHITPECFEPKGLQEYKTGMAILGSADFFVVEDTSPDDVGTKIYDYIYWNKPIIAAVPKEIPLAKLVSSFEHGYICETEEDVEDALNDIIENKYETLDSHIDIERYSRKYQNHIIEESLKRVVYKRR